MRVCVCEEPRALSDIARARRQHQHRRQQKPRRPWGTSSGGGIGAGGSGERRVRGGCDAFSEEAPSFGIGAGHAARHAEEAQGRPGDGRSLPVARCRLLGCHRGRRRRSLGRSRLAASWAPQTGQPPDEVAVGVPALPGDRAAQREVASCEALPWTWCTSGEALFRHSLGVDVRLRRDSVCQVKSAAFEPMQAAARGGGALAFLPASWAMQPLGTLAGAERGVWARIFVVLGIEMHFRKGLASCVCLVLGNSLL